MTIGRVSYSSVMLSLGTVLPNFTANRSGDSGSEWIAQLIAKLERKVKESEATHLLSHLLSPEG